jgi:hypothetical protein
MLVEPHACFICQTLRVNTRTCWKVSPICQGELCVLQDKLVFIFHALCTTKRILLEPNVLSTKPAELKSVISTDQNSCIVKWTLIHTVTIGCSAYQKNVLTLCQLVTTASS